MIGKTGDTVAATESLERRMNRLLASVARKHSVHIISNSDYYKGTINIRIKEATQ